MDTHTPPSRQEPPEVGALIATIIVVTTLVLGGLLIFVQQLHRVSAQQEAVGR